MVAASRASSLNASLVAALRMASSSGLLAARLAGFGVRVRSSGSEFARVVAAVGRVSWLCAVRDGRAGVRGVRGLARSVTERAVVEACSGLGTGRLVRFAGRAVVVMGGRVLVRCRGCGGRLEWTAASAAWSVGMASRLT